MGNEVGGRVGEMVLWKLREEGVFVINVVGRLR